MVRYTCTMGGNNIDKNDKPINVYWSNLLVLNSPHEISFLYPKPKTLFSELMSDRSLSTEEPLNSYFSCPAVSSKFKKILVFKNNMDSDYEYSVIEDEEKYIRPIKKLDHISAEISRPNSINAGPTIRFNLSYIFFADEPLEIYVTPPMFSKPQYMKYGSIIPGEFDIGQWFRPINFEVQMWEQKGTFSLKENEPIMYVEFKTKRPIILHRFVMNSALYAYQSSIGNSFYFFGRGKSLIEKYTKFKEVQFKGKILKEIKNEIIDEEPYRF